MAQPFFKKLAEEGVHFAKLRAQARPSQPNYFALTSGSIHGVKTNDNVDLDVPSIADQLESKGLTWKAYVEDYPGDCFKGKNHGSYARKHNPFISYSRIHKDKVRCARIVNSSEFDRDVESGKLPNYSFYVPNDKNSAHDTGVAYADRWYEGKFKKYLLSPKFMKDTVLISTFDESSGGAENHIYTSLVGPRVKAMTVESDATLYTLLKLIQDNWDLGDLGKEDAKASVVEGIWK